MFAFAEVTYYSDSDSDKEQSSDHDELLSERIESHSQSIKTQENGSHPRPGVVEIVLDGDEVELTTHNATQSVSRRYRTKQEHSSSSPPSSFSSNSSLFSHTPSQNFLPRELKSSRISRRATASSTIPTSRGKAKHYPKKSRTVTQEIIDLTQLSASPLSSSQSAVNGSQSPTGR